MRLTPPTLALASLLLLLSSAAQSQRDDRIAAPTSMAFVQRGNLALSQPAKADEAADYYETALAIDPQNRAALIGLARAAMAQTMPGKAIHYYREALAMTPNDVGLLAGQGEAMIAKGALLKANENLAKIKALCISDCPAQVALSNAIARVAEAPALRTAQVQLKPGGSDSVGKAD